MKKALKNYAFIDSQNMKKAAMRDFFHFLSPTHPLILNFVDRIGGWVCCSSFLESASISKSTALTIRESEPKALVQLETQAL
ncbi:MAG: hypothetical protein WCT19_01420 [Candidatus Paceibacterota bacterium]|jgi:hypothetical protein